MYTGSFKLVCLGLIGIAFFVLSDARFGLGARVDGLGQANQLDAIHAAWPGTIVGVAGSGLIVLIGLWLMVRRRA